MLAELLLLSRDILIDIWVVIDIWHGLSVIVTHVKHGGMQLCRLDRRFWCFDKKQLEQLQDEVYAYWSAKKIKNGCQEEFPYPQEIFDDPKLGPNIYQVMARLQGPAWCRHLHMA